MEDFSVHPVTPHYVYPEDAVFRAPRLPTTTVVRKGVNEGLSVHPISLTTWGGEETRMERPFRPHSFPSLRVVEDEPFRPPVSPLQVSEDVNGRPFRPPAPSWCPKTLNGGLFRHPVSPLTGVGRREWKAFPSHSFLTAGGGDVNRRLSVPPVSPHYGCRRRDGRPFRSPRFLTGCQGDEMEGLSSTPFHTPHYRLSEDVRWRPFNAPRFSSLRIDRKTMNGGAFPSTPFSLRVSGGA
ncbi:hypothetical protein AVEN_249188-1 [Araneus ventricosus]|uniref:Uncharacterized protein n=1 Tax=Araneus ventricosus TaxID=182803 RepID=A0A4Y2V6H9_ARAVE|nr:hypothetical protein AVEN_249188-1 [Araneus ventricosus]